MDRATIEERARKAIAPLIPLETGNPYGGSRTDAGRSLPPYYLVYFLLVDLLGFKNLGRWEKVAWSVPVEFNGHAFIISHRKFGLGIFACDSPVDEAAANEVAKLIHKGVKAAQPYFDHLASSAAAGSNLNVENNSRELHDRFQFYSDEYKKKSDEAERRKDEQVRKEFKNGYSISFPSFELSREAKWHALTAIEAFFSWTEHVFIHLAIIQGQITTGKAVAKMAEAQWADKFKAALDITDADTKNFYDQLLILRRQIRNFVSHGSFGKDGQAFAFHSPVGAVPLLLPHRQNNDDFKFGNGVDFIADDAMKLVNDFIAHLWNGDLSPAKIYIQESGLPLILSHAADGTYDRAMMSDEDMELFTEHQSRMWDDAANMDW